MKSVLTEDARPADARLEGHRALHGPLEPFPVPTSTHLPGFEPQVLVRRRPWIIGNESEPRLRHARTVPLEDGKLPDREIHDLLVDQLLDPMKDRLALLRVELTRLLSEEPVDVGIPPVGVNAARGRERLDPGGRVPEDPAQAVDNVPELLLLIRFEEPRPFERAKPRADPGRL